MTKWKKSRGAPTMVANMITCGARVGTTGPATRSSPKPRRQHYAGKRLVDEVKVSGLMFCWSIYILLLVHYVICIFLIGCNENGEVPKKVLRPN